jgi:hypothetical protein
MGRGKKGSGGRAYGHGRAGGRIPSGLGGVKGNRRELKGEINLWCYGRLIDCLDGQREQRKAGGCTGSAAAPPCRGRKGGRRKEGGEKGANRWDPPVGAAVKKKKKGESGGPAGELGWAAWAEKSRARFCFFFFFFFKPHFQILFNSNSNQTFANFSQEFYRLFRDHTSNQKPCKPTDDAHTLVVSRFIKLSLIFLELNLISNLISLNP